MKVLNIINSDVNAASKNKEAVRGFGWIEIENCKIVTPEDGVVVHYERTAGIGDPHGDFVSDVVIKRSHGETTTTATTTTTTTTTTTAKDVTAQLWGDANVDGNVELADAIFIMQVLSNPNRYTITDLGRANADVDKSTVGLTANDALFIQEYLLHLRPTLDPNS